MKKYDWSQVEKINNYEGFWHQLYQLRIIGEDDTFYFRTTSKRIIIFSDISKMGEYIKQKRQEFNL